jgi:hypothetical protein
VNYMQEKRNAYKILVKKSWRQMDLLEDLDIGGRIVLNGS